MAKMTPTIRGDRLVYQQDEQEQVLLVETPAWFAWLETASSFAFISEAGTFTTRKERAGNQLGSWYWKAYRTQQGKLTSLYIGKSETLTHDRLHAVATTLNTQTASTEQRLDAPHAASMIPGAFSPTPSEVTLRPREEMLLATKWFIPPPLPTLVVRPRLIARLTEGVRRPLTLLSAPAGWGKTTVLSTWYADSSRSAFVAWVSLETHDNDPVRFWTYIVTALNTLHAGVGDTALALLHAPQTPPMEMVLTSLVNALIVLSRETVLILDDYHVIEEQPIHDMVAYFIDHLPPQLHLVVATRSDPPLPLPRLLVRGLLTELRATELRFTPEEAATFLTERMGFTLMTEHIEALETRTEGWIAGLHLAALAMRDRADVAGFIASFTGSNRYVVDYLLEEVLQRQPEGVQNFLLRTSILDRLSGPLCDALLERDDSQMTLEQLERANLFLIPLDDKREWYRYHHLFADVLRNRLQQKQSSLIPELYHRASVWYEQHDMLIEAVQHALATPHFDRAARLIEQSGLLLMQHGRVHTFLDWISALPDSLVRTRLTLCLFHANALMFTHHLEEALARLRDAETCVEADMPAGQARSIMGEVAWLRGTIVRFSGDLAGCVALSRQALDLLPESEVSWRAFALLNESYAFLVSGDVTTATEHQLSEVAAPVYASGNPYGILGVIVLLARMRALQGRLRQAAATYDEMKQLVQGQEGFRLLTNSSYYFGMGDLLREWNELDAAERSIVQGMEVLGMMTINADMIALGYICLAGLHQARGEAEQALAALDTFTQLARQNHFTPLLVAHMSAVRAQLQLAQGDLAAALRWVDTSGLLLHDEQPGYLQERAYLTLARVRITQERAYLTLARVRITQGRTDPGGLFLQGSLDLLAHLLHDAEAKARMSSVIEILILRALALHAQKRTPAALATLDRALDLAEPEGYIRLFVDEGPPMAALLRHAYAHGRASGYIATLLAACGEAPDASSPRPSVLIEPLTERELEVLRLLMEGESNREIARHLVVSIGTAKKHVSNICGKLGVQSRTQAIARTRTLNLL